MKWEEFYYLLFEKDFKLLIFTFIANFFILLLFFRKNINNLFDPLNIIIINLSSCFTIFIYLFLKNLIVNNYFYQLVSINIFFLLALKVFLLKEDIVIFNKKLNKKFFKIYYIIHGILFILTTICFYKLISTNLMTDKLNAFNNFGVLRIISNFLFPGQLILIFIKREMYGYKNKIDYMFYFIILVLFFFSGGKTATITYCIYIFSIFYFLNFIQKNILYKKLKKYSFGIFIFSFIGVVILFGIINKDYNLGIILKKLLHRILSSGDIYYMAYVNNNIEKIRGISLFEYYIVSIVRPILKRIVELKEYPYPGFQIIKAVYGVETNSYGPNTRYDLVLQMNLTYFGIIGSILSGVLMGAIRKVKTANFILLEIIIILFVNVETIIQDFGLFGHYLFTCIFMSSIISIASFFSYSYIKNLRGY